MIAHTLGNPFNLKEIKKICEEYQLYLIEDNCDALGSTYEDKFTGTFGDISTRSKLRSFAIFIASSNEQILGSTESPTILTKAAVISLLVLCNFFGITLPLYGLLIAIFFLF